MGKENNLCRIAEELIEALLDRGFVIQRYDAYSTSSIYLKLDYGVSNSICISDHKGKSGLSYRYNIGTDVEGIHKEDDRYIRYFFPENQVGKLVALIEDERIQKIRRYGTKNYFEYMDRNREMGKTLPGFWQQARLIERGL